MNPDQNQAPGPLQPIQPQTPAPELAVQKRHRLKWPLLAIFILALGLIGFEFYRVHSFSSKVNAYQQSKAFTSYKDGFKALAEKDNGDVINSGLCNTTADAVLSYFSSAHNFDSLDIAFNRGINDVIDKQKASKAALQKIPKLSSWELIIPGGRSAQDKYDQLAKFNKISEDLQANPNGAFCNTFIVGILGHYSWVKDFSDPKKLSLEPQSSFEQKINNIVNKDQTELSNQKSTTPLVDAYSGLIVWIRKIGVDLNGTTDTKRKYGITDDSSKYQIDATSFKIDIQELDTNVLAKTKPAQQQIGITRQDIINQTNSL